MKHTCHVCHKDKHENEGEFEAYNPQLRKPLPLRWTCFHCLLRRRAYWSDK
jgi:hypothetical protein